MFKINYILIVNQIFPHQLGQLLSSDSSLTFNSTLDSAAEQLCSSVGLSVQVGQLNKCRNPKCRNLLPSQVQYATEKQLLSLF